ncbi:hypothetical protein T492DRAFT_1039507 [Pavlovales sp. CCMP2436]|nr:hypothetical protein T492DRAFT_1039507 [Pavlovales sp. CCMP2436]
MLLRPSPLAARLPCLPRLPLRTSLLAVRRKPARPRSALGLRLSAPNRKASQRRSGRSTRQWAVNSASASAQLVLLRPQLRSRHWRRMHPSRALVGLVLRRHLRPCLARQQRTARSGRSTKRRLRLVRARAHRRGQACSQLLPACSPLPRSPSVLLSQPSRLTRRSALVRCHRRRCLRRL